jgi:hypothetical protein
VSESRIATGGPLSPRLSAAATTVVVVIGLIAVAQLSLGHSFYPGLHTILDTGMFLLSGMLAVLFWDVGVHSNQSFLSASQWSSP